MKEVYQKLFLLFPRKGQLILSNYLFQYELSIALILVISVLLITGCAPKYKDVLQSYRDADICCKSMSEFNYEKINVGQSKEVLIDENNPAFSFSSGKSYFKAYELPETPEPYQIKVVSYSLVGGGPNYIFYPVLITLDKNFDEVRNTGKSDFIPQKNVWLEIPAKFAMMEHGFKLTGGLTFTNKNKNEKYLIVKTNAKYLEKNTFFPTPIYYTGDGFGKLSKNSPTGAIVVALDSTSNLIKNEFEKWFNSSEKVKIDKTYIGDGFTVLPPQNPNYRFKDESLTRYGVTQRRISFGKYQGGEIVGVFIDTKIMGKGSPSPDETFRRVVETEEEKLRSEFIDLIYEKSTTTVDGVECSRIDLFGYQKAFMSLPARGYDISCIHPDWSRKTPTLFVHIVGFYTNPEVEFITPLPEELLDFYKSIRFIKVEQ